MRDTSQSGFTLVEMMAVTLIGAILLGIGGAALRQYTRAKALEGARDTTVTQLRTAQQRTFTEGYPRAYGIRFLKNDTRWDVVRYDAALGTCTVVESHRLTDSVTVAATGTDFADSTGTSACAQASPGGSANFEVALFYGRGTATAGTVTFKLGNGKTRAVSVNGATGKAS